MAVAEEAPANHQENAKSLSVEVRDLILARVTGFLYMSTTQRRRMASRCGVPDAFLEELADAIELSPRVAGVGGLGPEELRDTVSFTKAFLQFATELEEIARGVRDTVAAKRGDVVSRGLVVYKLSQALAKGNDSPQLARLVAAMRRALGRGRPASR